jgi:putative FmdB family regulatory protein
MPTYQYKCLNDHHWEQERGIRDEEPLMLCPHCSEQLKRTYNAPAINLVGKGFYRNGG